MLNSTPAPQASTELPPPSTSMLMKEEKSVVMLPAKPISPTSESVSNSEAMKRIFEAKPNEHKKDSVEEMIRFVESATAKMTQSSMETQQWIDKDKQRVRLASKPITSSKPANYKTQLCQNVYKPGGCMYGEKCWYAHGVTELRKTYLAPARSGSLSVKPSLSNANVGIWRPFL